MLTSTIIDKYRLIERLGNLPLSSGIRFQLFWSDLTVFLHQIAPIFYSYSPQKIQKEITVRTFTYKHFQTFAYFLFSICIVEF
jgi:hypothetical protein